MAAMKTLTEIAQEAWQAADEAGAQDGEIWEAMCKAVRAAVIEECAKRIEGEYTGSIPYSGEWEARIDDAKAEVNRELVSSLRALKDKP